LTSEKTAVWPSAHMKNFKRKTNYRFAVLDWGTRGDIQPFIALGEELIRRGHQVLLAAREPFRELVWEHGLEFFAMPEDDTEGLMHALAASKNVPEMLQATTDYSRKITAPQMRAFWEASRGADVILSKVLTTPPSVHIAEGRGVPIFLAHFDPGFLPNELYCFWDGRIQDRGAFLNRLTAGFLLFSFGFFISDKINAWRRERRLRLDPLVMRNWSFHLSRFPTFAAWSTHFLPRPADWSERVVQTGWWILPQKESVDPLLRKFVRSGSPPVYIGFGSWGIHDKAAMTNEILEALRMTGNRAVLLRRTVDDRKEFPPGVLVADDLPHDWLLPRMKAAVHHGGAGTAGAVITAGVPSVVVPAFDMQAAWGGMVAERGIGTMLERTELTAEGLASALRTVEQPVVQKRARALGKKTQSDGGVQQAADDIERQLKQAAGRVKIHIVTDAVGLHTAPSQGPSIGPMPSPDPERSPRLMDEEPVEEERPE
jgi:sterol 3beta-glucosyltransferase